MHFIRALFITLLGYSVDTVYAGDLGAKLNTQIELLPSCFINNKPIADGTTNINLGEIDFGETNASFNEVIESSLIGENGAGIQIQCSGISQVKLTFGSGQNDVNVPSGFSGNYYHALTNGKDFVAYNLLYGENKLIIKPNDFFVLSNVNQPQNVIVFGRAINNGTRISMGSYSDIVPIVIEF
ncbi:spore coat protein U domain-containing protein [Acinetobacter sp. ESBL14]|uniref:spore coat protein U domain-containing protein n=1 Tax=Acinetobacter sp. ESBL14 TaxID=3077329 RepID=UPI002FCA0E0A